MFQTKVLDDKALKLLKDPVKGPIPAFPTDPTSQKPENRELRVDGERILIASVSPYGRIMWFEAKQPPSVAAAEPEPTKPAKPAKKAEPGEPLKE